MEFCMLNRNIMEKKTHKYHLVLTGTANSGEIAGEEKCLEMEIENHDELFGIISKITAKDPFGDPLEAAQFALGLKLFSEVMLKNRQHPLFEELSAVFPVFMKKLKSL